MSAKPWADPRQPLDERLAAAEVAIANVDTAAARIAVMRELVEGAAAIVRPFEPDPTAAADAARFRALAEQGKTGKQVAAALGVSYSRVVRLLHKSGFFRDKAARREAQAREGVTAVARGETIAAVAGRLGVKQGWLSAEARDRFEHDHPRLSGPNPPAHCGPCLWCGHPYTYGGYHPSDRCRERVKAIARGDEAALLSDRQRVHRDHYAPTA